MRKIIIAAAVTAAGLVGPAGAAASADDCATVRDVITKTDTGHGSPAAWADLVMHRSTTVCGTAQDGYTVTLTDAGSGARFGLWTRVGAGTPNGTGGQITRRVHGTVNGTYHLTVTGGTFDKSHRDASASSTEYVRSLFSDGATVTGGAYSWTYATCREKWVDSSANGDGQGAQAGNITGKRCAKPHPSPTPTSSASASPSPSTSSPSTPQGEAPVPTPVPGDLGVTG